MDLQTAVSAGGHEGRLISDKHSSFGPNFAELETLFSVVEQMLVWLDYAEAAAAPVGRFRQTLANGMQSLASTKFSLEGDKLNLISVFLAFFKRCTVLWKLLIKVNKHCSQRLLLKLEYSQNLTSRIFHKANLDVKLSLGGSMDASVIILDLCGSILQALPGILCVNYQSSSKKLIWDGRRCGTFTYGAFPHNTSDFSVFLNNNLVAFASFRMRFMYIIIIPNMQ